MKDVLLEYVMPIKIREVIPAVNTAYLHDVLCVVPPRTDVAATNTITECTSTSAVMAITDSQCVNMISSLNKIYVLDCDDLDISAQLAATTFKFFTIIIDPFFTDLSSFDKGDFDGVVAWASNDKTALGSFAIDNVAFYTAVANQGRNMYAAFASLLSGTTWRNQQYITMPATSDITTLGDADTLFDARVSFVLTSQQYGNKLAFFGCAGQAIVAKYLYAEIEMRLQGWSLTYLGLNQPDYNTREASLLETYLQGQVNAAYEGIVRFVTISVSLLDNNFAAQATIVIASPRAFWRVFAEVQEGDI